MPKQEGKPHQIESTSSNVKIVFPLPPFLITDCIGENAGREILTIGSDIPPGIPLPFDSSHQIGNVPFVPPLH